MFRIKHRNSAGQTTGIVTSDMVKKKKLMAAFAPSLPKTNPLTTLRGKLLAAVAVIVIVGIGLLVYSRVATPDPNAPVTVCNQDVLTEASIALKGGDLNKVATVAEKIKKLPNYDHDMNCDYVLVEYALMKGDTVAARAHLKTLRNFFRGSYSQYLTIPQLTPAQLDTLITNTEQAQDQSLQELRQQQEDSSAQDSAADSYRQGQ